ncbi:MAG: hypothetical protein WAT79_12825 [Saprospiraceae bacterium]
MIFKTGREFVKNRAIVHAFIFSNLFILVCSFEILYGLPNILKYLASVYVLLSLAIFYWYSDRIRFQSFFLKFLVSSFILFLVYLLFTSIRFEKFYIQEAFGDKFYLLPYVVPIIFLRLRYTLSTFRTILRLTYSILPFAILSLIFLIIFPDVYEYPDNVFIVLTFSFANALLLYVSHLLKWRFVTPLALLYSILFIILLASLGRRGETFEQFLPLILFVWIRIRSSSISTIKKGIFIALSLSAVIPASLYVYSISGDIYLFQRGLDKDGFNDTRGETVLNFLNDYGSRPNDYIIGRGLNGKVRKWIVATEKSTKFSRSIEIGYFDSLLKGGFVYLLLMLTLFLSSIYLGYFKSKNDLVKGLSFIVLWQILYMISFGLLNFSVFYFMLWIAVATCLDRVTRNYDNNYLIRELNAT